MDYNITTFIIDNKPFKTITTLNPILNSLIIPDYIDMVNCTINNLTELLLPDNLKSLICWKNNISELTLNKNLNYLSCDIFVDIKNINHEKLKIVFY